LNRTVSCRAASRLDQAQQRSRLNCAHPHSISAKVTLWGPAEIAEAIEHLAIADRIARDENGKVDAAIEIARITADGRR
jgi:hypothetical protein